MGIKTKKPKIGFHFSVYTMINHCVYTEMMSNVILYITFDNIQQQK